MIMKEAVKNTFNLFFYVRQNRVSKNGTVPIYCRITISKETTAFKVHKDINPKLWDVKNQKANGKSLEAVNINNLIESIKSNLHQKYKELLDRDSFVSPEKLKNAFFGLSQERTMLLEVFAEHNKDIKSLVGINKTKATLQKYEVTYKRLADFMKHKYNISDINMKEINHQFIVDFEIYLRTMCNCSSNTTAKFMQFFKRIIIIAKNNAWIIRDPFANYKIRIEKVDRGYLTDDELKKILKKKILNNRLELVRDIFIFSCYTGLAYIDVKTLTYDKIKEGLDKNLWIMSKRVKTNTNISVPILDIPLALIEKYKGKQNNDIAFPILSNQKMNSYLKEIGALCGIDKNLTFHLARHTFATTVTLGKGIPIESVSKMLGHTNIKTTQIYARTTEEKISRDMQILTKKKTVKMYFAG